MKTPDLHIFSTRDAYLLIATSMFLGLFIGISLQGLVPQGEGGALLDRLVLLIGELVIMIPPLFILAQRKVTLMEVLPFHPISPITILMSMVMICGVIGLVAVYEVLIIPYFPVPEFLQQMDDSLFDGGMFANIMLIIAAVVVAPVVEEFLFRGLLQQSLFYQYGSLLPALVIPTIIFALFHIGYLFYVPALIELLALGILLAWLMAKTGNVLIPILVHALFNLSAFTGLFMGADTNINTLSDLGVPWIVGSIVLFGMGWVYFISMQTVVRASVYLIPSPHEVDS